MRLDCDPIAVVLARLRLLRSGASIHEELEARRLCAAFPGPAFIQKPYTAKQIAGAVEDLLGLPGGVD